MFPSQPFPSPLGALSPWGGGGPILMGGGGGGGDAPPKSKAASIDEGKGTCSCFNDRAFSHSTLGPENRGRTG